MVGIVKGERPCNEPKPCDVNLFTDSGKCNVMFGSHLQCPCDGGDANMVVVNKGNVGDGNIVHKAIVSYTSLVDKDLIDNVVEIRDMDMLVVDNVVNSNLADNGKGVSIDDEVLVKHMKLDKGKSTMT
ncbi:hypothetical protein Tco_1139869 [Tanacetum coccineum]